MGGQADRDHRTFAVERDADADQYQCHSYTRLYVEEIGTFPSPAIFKLMATLRSSTGVPVGLLLAKSFRSCNPAFGFHPGVVKSDMLSTCDKSGLTRPFLSSPDVYCRRS
jgi:hypothetical protein